MGEGCHERCEEAEPPDTLKVGLGPVPDHGEKPHFAGGVKGLAHKAAPEASNGLPNLARIPANIKAQKPQVCAV